MTEVPVDPDQPPTPDDVDSARPDHDESDEWDTIVPDELIPVEDPDGA
jgi:hypothetical protein